MNAGSGARRRHACERVGRTGRARGACEAIGSGVVRWYRVGGEALRRALSSLRAPGSASSSAPGSATRQNGGQKKGARRRL